MNMETKISVKDLMMQAFLTGWELSDKSISQDEYLQSSIDVIEVLQVEPENVYAEEGLGLTDGDEVDHLDGTLFIDRMSRLRRTLYDGKVKKWLKRKTAG